VHYLAKPATAYEVFAALHRDEGDASISISGQPPSIKRLECEHLQEVLTRTWREYFCGSTRAEHASQDVAAQAGEQAGTNRPT
jgi:ActR/RegA family two-component response regulator